MKLSELHLKCINSGKYPLFPGATRLVPGYGNPKAEIMFIGEAPGADEDAKGIPFVGRAGKFLDEMLQSIGVAREEVYITNMVKCRPPNNRDPEESDINLYKAWLDFEIELIQPKVFVPLGRFALGKFLPGRSISQVHGQTFRVDGKIFFAMYHPAVALYKGSMREVLLADIQNLKKILDGDESGVEDLTTMTNKDIEEIKARLKKEPPQQAARAKGQAEQLGLV